MLFGKFEVGMTSSYGYVRNSLLMMKGITMNPGITGADPEELMMFPKCSKTAFALILHQNKITCCNLV